MHSRLFHSIVVCGAALTGLPVACASEPLEFADEFAADTGRKDEASAAAEHEKERCRTEDGGCNEHCPPIADGGCLDPCFVHTATCSPDCLTFDGGCGWPPTK